MFDEIFKSKSRSKRPAIISLDIRKAFDTVEHDKLIKKLIYYGLGGTVIKWFMNFLTGRFQMTRNGKCKSTFLPIVCGVPQGSVLGPLLFSIYVNDLPNACNLSLPFIFADDTNLLFEDCCRNSLINLKIELMTVMKWLDVNKLSLNIGKTLFMILDGVDTFSDLSVSYGNSVLTIKEVHSLKYLGLMIDHKLSFSDHIAHVRKKVMKRIGAMYKSKNLLPVKYRKMFANALMLPQFDYLDIIYNKAGKTKLNELDILYKKVAKIALDVPRSESSIKVYKDMKWLPLHLRRQLHLASYMYRIINNDCPANFIDRFSYISGGSRIGSSCNLYLNPSRTHKEFYYLGAKCWNNLSNELRNSSNVKEFSSKYKTLLLESIVADTSYVPCNAFDKLHKTD